MEVAVTGWIYLFLAALFEIGWALGLKYTEGFTRPMPTLLTVASMVASLALLGLAVKTLPLERFSVFLNRQGFPGDWVCDSRCWLGEASTNDATFIQ